MLVSGVFSSWLTFAVNFPPHGLVVLAQFAVLLDGVGQRFQLGVGHVGFDVIQMLGHAGDGPHQAAGQPPGQQRPQRQHHQHAAQQPGQRLGVGRPQVVGLVGQAQDVAVGQAQGIVVGLVPHRGTAAGGRAGAGLQRRLHLRAVQVVFDVGRVGGFIQHVAVRLDQRQPQRVPHGEIVLQHRYAVVLVGGGDGLGGAGQVPVQLPPKGAVEQKRGAQRREQHADQADQGQAFPDAAGHAFKSFHPRPPRPACSPPCARCGSRPRHCPAFGAGCARACRWCGIPADRRCPRRLS